MRTISKLAALGVLLFTVFPAVSAQAETCADDDRYCSPDTPDRGSNDDNRDDDDDESGGGDTGGGGDSESPRGDEGAGGDEGGDEGAVLPSDDESTGGPGGAVLPASAAAEAPTGSLPLTGGDIIGMSAVAVAALGLGTLLVRRSKVGKRAA